jgi:hypothetical protein
MLPFYVLNIPPSNVDLFVQELELTGRSSLGRSEVMSGVGGELPAGEQRTDMMEILGDTRDKVAKLLSQLESGEGHVPPLQDYALLLGELLLHSDQVTSTGNIYFQIVLQN